MILLESVTLDVRHFSSFYQALTETPGFGLSIQSLRLDPMDTTREEGQYIINSQLASISKHRSIEHSEDSTDLTDNFLEFQRLLFSRLSSLQSLTIIQQASTPRSLKGLSCFPNSLKKLYISFFGLSSPDQYASPPLNAKNVIWLLSFGLLQEACLGMTISTSDFGYLSEHHQAFGGTSKIKKLSICFYFVYKDSDQRTWWGTSRERSMKLNSANMKTEALKLLLSVVSVSRLECLELYPWVQQRLNLGDDTVLNPDYLFSRTVLFVRSSIFD